MNRRLWLLAAAAGALLGASTLLFESLARADAAGCSAATPELESMALREIAFMNPDGARVGVTVREARTAAQLRAGFQHICPATIRGTSILFVFPVPLRTRFHMSNVHGALDIAFIAADGNVLDVVRMQPYGDDPGAGRRLYGTSHAFQYALEAAPGFFDSRGIVPGGSRMVLAQ